MNAVAHPDAGAFLERAGVWLERAEDEHNLALGLAAAWVGAGGPEIPAEAPLWLTVEDEGDVVGCALRTPPHKLLLTRMPVAAAGPVARAAAERYETLPAVLGPRSVAWAVAEAWVAEHGGRAVQGRKQRLHRLDRVGPPEGVRGALRLATPADLGLAEAWAEAFAGEAGMEFRTAAATRRTWVVEERLHLWEDEGAPVCMAVWTGATRRGVRVGYVYTPPERRGRGYATALVAALSRKLLEAGFSFCVLYTDLANPVSNAIYARIGYRPVCDVEDVRIERDEDGV